MTFQYRGIVPSAEPHIVDRNFREINEYLSQIEAELASMGASGIDGSGTAGTVPKFSDSNTIADSIISEASGALTIAGVTKLGSTPTTISNADGTLKHAAIEQNSASDGQVLTWNNVSSVWEPQTTGSGDVSGPASATDNAIARFDGMGGKTIQNSGVLIDDSDNVTGVQNLSALGPTITLGDGNAVNVAIGGTSDLINNSLVPVAFTLDAGNSGDAIPIFELRGHRLGNDKNLALITSFHDTNRLAEIRFQRGNADDEGYLQFVTRATGGSQVIGLEVHADQETHAHGDLTVDGDATVNGELLALGTLRIASPEATTISSGAITVTKNHVVANPETGTSDDLDTINGGLAQQVLVVRSASGDTVTVKDGTGNLQLAGDFVLDSIHDRLVLHYDGANWCELSRSNNS